jgi:DNA mismatch repair protein MSH5
VQSYAYNSSADRSTVENKSGIFQIRPFKEFVASKGRERLLSLCRLSTFTPDEDVLPPSSDIESNSSRRDAYSLMRTRRELTGDPTARRWTASIRLANFASLESSPSCVRKYYLISTIHELISCVIQMASIGALLDHILRERALTDHDDEGMAGLDIRDIEILSLCDFETSSA